MKTKSGVFRGSAAVLFAMALICVLAQQAYADPPHFIKCVGSQSSAWGSCPEGCDPIEFRIVKGGTVIATSFANPWTWTWLEAWGTGDFTVQCSCNGGDDWDTAATCTVAKLSSLTADGCQEVGKETHYIALKGTGDVVITASLTPSGIDAGALPSGFVTWTGGTAGSDQLHRKVSRSAAANTTVTATCCATNKSVVIHVVDAEAPGTNTAATLTDTNGAALTCDPFGRMLGDRGSCGDPVPDFVARLNCNQWVLRLNSVSHVHRTGINGGDNKIDVTSADDADVTAQNYNAVINDLTPPAQGSGYGPPRNTYWCSDICQSHENFHVSDFHSNYWSLKMVQFETWVEGDAANQINFDCNNAETMTASGVHGLRDTAVKNQCNAKHDEAWTAYHDDGWNEVAAHNYSNPQYTARNTAIFNRFNP